jgi:hypothetical protein
LAAESLVERPARPVGGPSGRSGGCRSPRARILALASNLAKGEAERIFLPFAVWLLPTAAALPGRDRRGWLAAQVAVALIVQLGWRLRW